MATTPKAESHPTKRLGLRRGDGGLWLILLPAAWLLFSPDGARRFGDTSRFAITALLCLTVGGWPKRAAGALWWYAALLPWIWAAWWLERGGAHATPWTAWVWIAGVLALAVAWGARVPSDRRAWAYAWYGLIWMAPIGLGLWRAAAGIESPALERCIAWGPAPSTWQTLQGPWEGASGLWQAALVLAALTVGVHFGFRRRKV